MRVLLVADMIWYFGEGMFGPLFAVFTERIGGDILDISWAWAIYLVVSGVLTVFFGKISDGRISKRSLLITGYALNALCTFGYLFIQTPAQLFFLQALLGLAAAMATPTWDALYSKYEDPKHSGLAWGLSDGLQQIFTGIAIVIGGVIVTLFNFSALFVIMGAVQVVSVFSILLLTSDERPSATHTRKSRPSGSKLPQNKDP